MPRISGRSALAEDAASLQGARLCVLPFESISWKVTKVLFPRHSPPVLVVQSAKGVNSTLNVSDFNDALAKGEIRVLQEGN